MAFGSSIHKRVQALERLAAHNTAHSLARRMSKTERDAAVRLALSSPESRTVMLAALRPGDDQGRAAIEAAFRADT